MISRFFPIIALILAVGLFFGYINPTRTGSIAASQAQIDSYESALEAAERFKEKESELVIARANIPSEGLARLETFLPDGVDNVQIILDLNTLAARSGITLSDFDTTPTASSTSAVPEQIGFELGSNGPIDSIELTVSATGSYASFRTFLDGIEKSLRLLDVVSVSVKDSPTGVYTYDMVIRLYWLR
jgi:Tfp pilus assembly protein PilO